jgi:capsular polysaccharide biosynthesis protein
MESASSRAASLRSALQRGLWLTIALTLVFAAAGGAFGWSRQRDARAESVILLNPLDGNPFSTTGRGDSLTNLETEAQLARGNSVAERVQQRLESTATPAELLDGLGVNAPTNTQLLTFTYSHADPEEAVRRAQAFAEEFLSLREARSRDIVDSQISLLDGQIKALQADQAELAEALLKPKLPASDKTVLQNQLDAATTQINQLRAHRSELQIGPFNPGQVVTPAALHREGLLDSWVAFAAIGALGGLVLSLLIAIVRARLDSRVHHVDDVALAGRTLLGEVDAGDAAEVNHQLRTLPAIGELPASYRELRVSLLTARRRRPLVLLAASSSGGAGQVPRFAPGLAVALAAARLRTVVIDTLGIWPLPAGVAVADLAGYLDGQGETPGPAPLVPLGEFLSLLPASELAAPDDVFMSPEMAHLIADLRQGADVVVMIGGGLGSSAARALADLSDTVICEVREGESSYRDLAIATPAIEAKDAGVVYLRHSSVREARRRVRTEPRWKRRSSRPAELLPRTPDEPAEVDGPEAAGPEAAGPEADGPEVEILEADGSDGAVVEGAGQDDSEPEPAAEPAAAAEAAATEEAEPSSFATRTGFDDDLPAELEPEPESGLESELVGRAAGRSRGR